MDYSLPVHNFLREPRGIRSWLLTTDHKRVAMLYLISVALAFVLGGASAVMIRLELIGPGPDFMTADTYNKLFTLHGAVMIFLFLIPAMPAVFGNFLLPIQIGTDDVFFPKLNLLSFYIYLLYLV